MESKELMLGNWVKYAHNSFWIEEIQGQPVQIDIDNYQEIYFDEGGTPKYEPIVITPEILEMAGFDKSVWNSAMIYEGQGMKLYLRQNKGLFFIVQESEQFTSTNDIVELLKDASQEERNNMGWVQKENKVLIPYSIKYLHQLQNLYFALTGTHLKIELK